MAENSGFWSTNAAGSGDQQASYSQADFSDAYRILSACASFEGVAVNFLNELECTDGGFETVDVDTGGAMVDGKWFLNDASQSVTIPSAVGVGNTRIDRIVARADWANFNVSVYRIAGTDAASPTAPAVTQTSETTYDIKLCQVLVDTSGNVSVTDEREWAEATKHVGNIYKRQGGSSSLWGAAGSTNYDVSGALIQCGCSESLGSDYVSITFPESYSSQPLVFIEIVEQPLSGTPYYIRYSALSNIGISYDVRDIDTNTRVEGIKIYWIAIGPQE
jgi:hypothetical protein